MTQKINKFILNEHTATSRYKNHYDNLYILINLKLSAKPEMAIL